jgi:hypothetical protein
MEIADVTRKSNVILWSAGDWGRCGSGEIMRVSRGLATNGTYWTHGTYMFGRNEWQAPRRPANNVIAY